MKKLTLLLLACVFSVSLSGCGLMEDAFKAGFIIALVLAAIVGLLIWILHFSWKLLVKHFPVLEGFWED